METFLLLFVGLVVFGWIIGIKDWLDKRAEQAQMERTRETAEKEKADHKLIKTRIETLVGTEGNDEERQSLKFVLWGKIRQQRSGSFALHPVLYDGRRDGNPYQCSDYLACVVWSELDKSPLDQGPASLETFAIQWRKRWREELKAQHLRTEAALAEIRRREAVKKAKEEIILHLADKIRTDGRICP